MMILKSRYVFVGLERWDRKIQQDNKEARLSKLIGGILYLYQP
jgi:hypothetical protein